MSVHTLQGRTAGAGTDPVPTGMSWKGNGHPSRPRRSEAAHFGKTGCAPQKDPTDGPKTRGQGGGHALYTAQALHKPYSFFARVMTWSRPGACAEHASHSMSMGFVRK